METKKLFTKRVVWPTGQLPNAPEIELEFTKFQIERIKILQEFMRDFGWPIEICTMSFPVQVKYNCEPIILEQLEIHQNGVLYRCQSLDGSIAYETEFIENKGIFKN